MAENFKAQEFNLSEINGGQHYENGQVLSAETINKVVEGAAYGQGARQTADEALGKSKEALSNSTTALSNSTTALEKASTAETNASEAKKTADDLKADVYNKTEVKDLIASSHTVNITQMASVYPNEAAIQKIAPSEGNGARYLVWVWEGNDKKLFYYSYNDPAGNNTGRWEKGYQIKGSTLYLNLADGCMYRYTNNPNTPTYPHFIKMTISPATIEEELGKKANASDVELLEEEVDVLNEEIGKKANSEDLAAVATSGSYEDLINKPKTETLTFTIEGGGTVTMQVLVGSVTVQ